MPTPTNSPSATVGATRRQDSALFAQMTERQEMPQVTQTFKGLGEMQRLIVEKVGVIARARLLVKLAFECEAEAKLAIGCPQRFIRSVALEANGVTGIIEASAMTIEQRRRRVYRNPVKAVETCPKTATALEASKKYEVEFVLDVPIAHDLETIIGALLAQNEETQLSLLVTWASEEEILESSKKFTKIEGEIKWSTTTFSIGTINEGGKEVTILPDLSAFHGLLDNKEPFAGTGERKAPLIRTDGQLLVYTASVLNGPHAEISPAEWTTFFLEYGGNKKPRVWTPAAQLLEVNADDYDGPIDIAGVHYLVLDNEADNPSRDMIVPAALTELRGVIGIPSGAAINSNAAILASQETLYPAV